MTAVSTKETSLKKAEERIRKILIDLEEEIETEIDEVRVDTRQFENMRVGIFLRQ